MKIIRDQRGGFSRTQLVVLLAFVCLAGIVDLFVVPHLQTQGMGLVRAILCGSLLVGAGAAVLLMISFQIYGILKTYFRRGRD
jgi:hypothetical protein